MCYSHIVRSNEFSSEPMFKAVKGAVLRNDNVRDIKVTLDGNLS